MIHFIRIFSVGLIAAAVLTGCMHNNDFSEFNALTISQTDSFQLDMKPAEALPLFTAPGEKLWIPTWDPVVLSGDGYEKGTVFVTTNHGNTTYWLVSEYNVHTQHARYVRVTPEADTGTVDVKITPNGKDGSTVNVSYQLTSLSPSGNENLKASYSKLSYAEMMKEWQTMINNSRETIDAHFGR